jgi:hypothetical protein
MPIDRPWRGDRDDLIAYGTFLGMVIGTLAGIVGLIWLIDWLLA